MTDYAPMRLVIETERLILRPWTDADVPVYRELIAERGAGLPSAQSVEDKIAAQHARAAEAGFALLAAHRRPSGEVIGYCGLTVGRTTEDEPELAFELFRRVHNQGYATEAARAVIEAAMATDRKRLWATIRSWNAASLRVAGKLGFLRDHSTFDEKGEIVWNTLTLADAPAPRLIEPGRG